MHARNEGWRAEFIQLYLPGKTDSQDVFLSKEAVAGIGGS